MSIRLKITLAFLLITVVVYQAMAKGPAGVIYTRHNLANWNPDPTAHFKSTNVNEVCVFCHTPHMAGGWPLWNKDVSVRVDRNTGNTIPVTFLAYTTNYTPMPQSLGYETLLCMSCHDGVSSMGVLHNNPNSVGEGINAIQFSGGADQIGDISSFDVNGFRTTGFADIGDASVFGGPGLPSYQDRANAAYQYYQQFGMMFAPYKDPNTGELLGNTADHPISINYDNVVSNPAASGKFHPKAATGLPFFGSDKSQLECTTCHDPHVNYVNVSAGGDPRYKPFLTAPNASSALCFRCHIK